MKISLVLSAFCLCLLCDSVLSRPQGQTGGFDIQGLMKKFGGGGSGGNDMIQKIMQKFQGMMSGGGGGGDMMEKIKGVMSKMGGGKGGDFLKNLGGADGIMKMLQNKGQGGMGDLMKQFTKGTGTGK